MPSNYLPSSDAEKKSWLKNYSAKLVIHGPILGLSDSEITSTTNDSVAYSFILDTVDVAGQDYKGLVAYKNAIADGDINSVISAFPTMSVIDNVPTTVGAGIFKRIAKLVQRGKKHPNYTYSIGQDLGIEGHQATKSAAIEKPELNPSCILPAVQNIIFQFAIAS